MCARWFTQQSPPSPLRFIYVWIHERCTVLAGAICFYFCLKPINVYTKCVQICHFRCGPPSRHPKSPGISGSLAFLFLQVGMSSYLWCTQGFTVNWPMITVLHHVSLKRHDYPQMITLSWVPFNLYNDDRHKTSIFISWTVRLVKSSNMSSRWRPLSELNFNHSPPAPLFYIHDETETKRKLLQHFVVVCVRLPFKVIGTVSILFKNNNGPSVSTLLLSIELCNTLFHGFAYTS